MAPALHSLLSEDHERLDALLSRCLDSGDAAAYDAFRRGILRHIAIEERVLFPLLRKAGVAAPLIEQLHRDHAAISSLLVPPPALIELRQLAAILASHNELEENAGGMYEQVETLVGEDLNELMARVAAVPEVPVMPNVDTPVVRRSIEQLLREADEGRRKLRDAGHFRE